MLGVFSLSVAVINISLKRGIPNVTLAPPCPAKWKVFKVIYVDGSPIDYAAVAPTPSTAWAKELKYLALIRPKSFLSEIID